MSTIKVLGEGGEENRGRKVRKAKRRKEKITQKGASGIIFLSK
jgi:hypothetical protein